MNISEVIESTCWEVRIVESTMFSEATPIEKDISIVVSTNMRQSFASYQTTSKSEVINRLGVNGIVTMLKRDILERKNGSQGFDLSKPCERIDVGSIVYNIKTSDVCTTYPLYDFHISSDKDRNNDIKKGVVIAILENRYSGTTVCVENNEEVIAVKLR